MLRSHFLFRAAAGGALSLSVFAQSYAIQTIAGTTTIKDGIAANTAFLRDPASVVADSSGNIYIADRAGSRIRKVGRDGIISTIAGNGIPGHAGEGGQAAQAQVNTPFVLAIDKNNNLYFAEYATSQVRKVSLTTGIVTTVAGNGHYIPSRTEGTKALEVAMDPQGIALDSKGNLLIADGTNSHIRRVTPDGTITTIAGINGCGDAGENQPATAAQICFPTQLGTDPSDNIFFIDYGNSRIRRIDAKSGIITGYLGDGLPFSGTDGRSPINTSVGYPDALALDSAGNLYISESGRVRLVRTGDETTVRTIAGTGAYGYSGDKGSATAAKLGNPTGLFPFSNGDVLLADQGNLRIRKITAGVIDTVAGATIADGVSALLSLFNGPSGVSEDSAGNIYVADTYNNRIRKLTASTGTVSTILGDGLASTAPNSVASPDDVAVDSKGLIYVTDTYKHRIMQIQPDGSAKLFAGGNGSGYSGDGSFAKNARLNLPGSIVVDKNDVVYFSDTGNNRIRKIGADGLIQPVAGNGNVAYSGDGANARLAGMSPRGLAIDSDGTLYVADYDNLRVRRIDPSGVITTIAGTGLFGIAGDGGKATDALFISPLAVALDPQHNLLITDQFADVIRRVNLTTGIISTIAGTNVPASSAESGAAIATSFTPTRLFVEKNGSILVSDEYNDRIRRLTPLTARLLSVISGDKGTGTPGSSLAISVQVTDQNKYAIQGQTISFTIAGGDATLSAPTAATGVDGVATVQVKLGTTVGDVTVRADSAGLTSVTFALTITPPTIVAPVVSSVIGAGQSNPAVASVSKNMAALVIIGTLPTVCDDSGFCVPGPLGTDPAPPYPLTLNQTCVTVGGVPAPVVYTTAAAIKIIVPDVPAGPQDVIVTNACGTGNDAPSGAFSTTVAPTSPELLLSARLASGSNYVTAVDTAAQTPVGTPSVTPALPGETISITLLGLGDTSPQEPIGNSPVDSAPAVAPVTVTLGGNPLPPEAITFAGLSPGAIPGLYRIDIVIPMDAAQGDQVVTVQAGDAVSPPALLTIGVPAPPTSLPDGRKIGKDAIRQLHKRQQ